MKTNYPWFRMYAEAVDDDKLRLLAFEDRWHFVALLCLKTQGILDEANPDLRQRRIGVKLGLTSLELETVMDRLSAVGLVDPDSWEPVNWDKRQYQSDSLDKTAADRMRRFRDRKRNAAVTVTEPVTGVTATDTDTDTDTEKEKKRVTRKDTPPVSIPEGLNEAIWQRWVEYRAAIKRPIKAPSIHAAQVELAKFGSDQAAVVQQSIANTWQGLFELKGKRDSHGTVTTVQRDKALWSEAKARAQAIGFREPGQHESPAAYMTAIKQAENAPRGSVNSIVGNLARKLAAH